MTVRLPVWSKIIVFLALSGIIATISSVVYVTLASKRMAELAPNKKYIAGLSKDMVGLGEPLPPG